MSPDDKRHGTRAGYYAHRAVKQDACDPCKRAAASAEAKRAYLRMQGTSGRLDPTGTRRRLQALHALGWTWEDIANRLDTTRSAVEKWANEPKGYVFASTATKIAGVYEEMSGRRPEGWLADRTRTRARRLGYAPPLAWDDIDHDRAPVGVVGLREDDVDSVVVDRILSGDWNLRANLAERDEVLARWLAAGGTQNELERHTGWNVSRMLRRTVAA